MATPKAASEGTHSNTSVETTLPDRERENVIFTIDLTSQPEVPPDATNVKVNPMVIKPDVKRGIIKTRRYDRKYTPGSIHSSVLRKHYSEPNLRASTYINNVATQLFDNPAFEIEDLSGSNLTFADVVKQVIKQPIEDDLHPYGRGNVYASAFGGKKRVNQDEGKMFIWILVAMVILGLACAVILMSVTYQLDATSNVTTMNPTAAENNTSR